MNQPATIPLLNRLLGVVSRSFLQYIKFSQPYVPAGRKEVLETLAAMAADLDSMADRISQMIMNQQELPRTGQFPMGFTDMHDLDIDFLVRVAIDCQRQDIVAVEQLVEQLQMAPAAKSLAEETLGMAKGHLQSLEELAGAQMADNLNAASQPAGST